MYISVFANLPCVLDRYRFGRQWSF